MVRQQHSLTAPRYTLKTPLTLNMLVYTALVRQEVRVNGEGRRDRAVLHHVALDVLDTLTRNK